MSKDKLQKVIHGAGGGGGGESSSCFPAGVPVLTPVGSTPIEQLKVGDEVLSFDDAGQVQVSKITKIHAHPPEQVWKLKYWGGGSVRITNNHWVLNQYNSFVVVSTLSQDDCVVDQINHLRPVLDFEKDGIEATYNLTVTPNHTFIAGGIRVHNGGKGQTRPTIHGAGGGGNPMSAVGKATGGSSRAAIEATDTLRSRAMVNLLDLIGEGEIGGLVNGPQSIFFDNTPLQNADGSYNFQGTTWEFRTGTQNQSIINGFATAEAPYSVATKVVQSTPIPFTISNPNVDQVRIVVGVPSLQSQDIATGDINGTSVQYMFQMSINGGAFQNVATEDGQVTLTISGKSRSQYQRNHIITLPKPATTWTIKMIRLTADSVSNTVANDIRLESYTEIINSQLSYPNSALIGIRIDSALFNKVPNRAYVVDGLYIKVPSNYDPVSRAYTGVWDGSFKLAVSDNPAWILYDLLVTKRYGLGEHITAGQVDKAKLYQIGKYCDGMVPDGFGGTEPRFRINTVIQAQAEAYKVISDITSVFRGMGFWAGNIVGFTNDAPSDTAAIFTPANVIDGLFTYTGSARKDRHSVAHVTWNDPGENYRQKIEYVEDTIGISQYGIRKVDTVAFGCTSRGQAARVGRWILFSERLESDLIQFKVGIDSAMLMPGEIVKIQDPFRSGKRMGGRAISVSSNSITLDAPVTFSSTGANISIRLADGTFADRPVLEGAGTHSVLTWTEPLTVMPVANAMWIAAEPNLQPLMARIVSINQDANKKTEFEVTAVEHAPGKYDAIENGLTLEAVTTTIINPNVIFTPIDLQIYESSYYVAPGVIGAKLNISWFGQSPSFRLQWRRTDAFENDWQTITTNTMGVELENVRKATHEFRLVGVNALGRASSPPVEAFYTVVGQTTAPGDVANFQVTRRTNDLLITWDIVTDIDAPTYEVRVGPSWEDSELVIGGFSGSMAIHDQSTDGTFYYHIRSINSSGIYSTNVSTFALIIDAPANISDFNCVQSGQRLEFRWTKGDEANIVGYELREGPDWATSNYIANVQATTYTLSSGSDGDRTFWIKAIASPGVYSKLSSFITTTVTRPQNTNVIVSNDRKPDGFLGTVHHASLVTGSLVMDADSQTAEYLFDNPLITTFRAQNILYHTISSVALEATRVWSNAGFTWASPEASRHWEIASDDSSIAASFQIAVDSGLYGSEVFGLRLSEVLTTAAGASPSASAGTIVYGKGRYGSGLKMIDTVSATWAAAIPSEFSQTFWISPDVITNANIITMTGTAGKLLKVRYDEVAGKLILEDQLGNKNEITVALVVGKYYCIGIDQASTSRTLFIGNMDGTGIQSVTQAHATLGALTTLKLAIGGDAYTWATYPYTWADSHSSILTWATATTERSLNGIMSDILVSSASMNLAGFASVISGGHAPGFGPFREFITGDYNYQNAIYRVVMTSTTSDRASLDEMKVVVDVPDVIDRGNVTIGFGDIAGIRVNFSRNFHVIPEITATLKGGTIVSLPRVSSPDLTGFTIKLEDPATGTGVTGIVAWQAVGY